MTGFLYTRDCGSLAGKQPVSSPVRSVRIGKGCSGSSWFVHLMSLLMELYGERVEEDFGGVVG